MRKVYVLGGAQTDFERNWHKEGKTAVALLREAVEDGLTYTGLDYDDIKRLNNENKIACFVGNFLGEYYINQSHLGALLTEVDPAFYGIPSARYEAACASGSAALDAAAARIRAGDYEVAIVIGFELMKTVDAQTGGDYLGRAALYEEEAKGVDYPFPQLFGRLAQETIARYHLNTERYLDNLASISAINYANAKQNPCAQTRKWFMSKEQAASRGTVSNPLIGGFIAASDCSQITDGAALVILTSEAFKNRCFPDKPTIMLKGYGHRTAPIRFDTKIESYKTDACLLPWTRQAVLDAYQRADLTVRNIDFFETHDCFTSSEYCAISAFGITAFGREHEAIEDGRISFNGDTPVNPSGGLIGCGHPVGASGVRMFLDLYKQVSGRAGGYQLAKAENGMMLNIGGSATTNYTFIVGRE